MHGTKNIPLVTPATASEDKNKVLREGIVLLRSCVGDYVNVIGDAKRQRNSKRTLLCCSVRERGDQRK